MPPKKRAPKGMAKPLPPGQILTDLRKKEWKLGELIGQGGFGYLYLGKEILIKCGTKCHFIGLFNFCLNRGIAVYF